MKLEICENGRRIVRLRFPLPLFRPFIRMNVSKEDWMWLGPLLKKSRKWKKMMHGLPFIEIEDASGSTVVITL